MTRIQALRLFLATLAFLASLYLIGSIKNYIEIPSSLGIIAIIVNGFAILFIILLMFFAKTIEKDKRDEEE